jgi:hypothetical protein
LSGCKSHQKTVYTNTKKISKNKLFKQLKKHRFNAKTLETRFAFTYADQYQSLSGNGKLRILKDSIIWGSLNFLGIPVVKFYMTPTKIRYYNKLDRTYYDGNFDLLQQQLRIPVNFSNFQNILTGDLVKKFDNDKVNLETSKNLYQLTPDDTYVTSVKVYPFFKIMSELFSNGGREAIELHYTDYQTFDQENLPTNVLFNIPPKKLQLHYKNISLNKELTFSFKLPEN